MKCTNGVDAVLVTLGLFLLMSVGFCMGGSHAAATYRDEAVKRGFAEYNQTTGAWQWKRQQTSEEE